MLQKAKSIKKTLKTEAKAIAYGTERVDKRGKPVTSIADRTNVRVWFWFDFCLGFETPLFDGVTRLFALALALGRF